MAYTAVGAVLGVGTLLWWGGGIISDLTGRVAGLEEAVSGAQAGPKSPEQRTAPAPESDKIARLVLDLAARIDELDARIANYRVGHKADEDPEQLDRAPGGAIEDRERDSAGQAQAEAHAWQEAERRFVAEAQGTSWGPNTEMLLHTSFANTPALRDVDFRWLECRSEGCKLSWRWPEGLTNEEYFILENEFYAALGDAGVGSVTVRPDPTGGFAAFAFRPEEPSRDGSPSDTQ